MKYHSVRAVSSILRGAAVALCVVLPLARGRAQATAASTTATVEGTIYDSVRSTPLTGATVQLVSRAEPSQIFTAETDTGGAFRIAGVPRGEFIIGFLHTELSELDLGAVSHKMRVDSEPVVRVALSIPGAVAIRTALCGAPDAGDSSGTVVGFVRDADSDMPIAGARVTVAWRNFGIDKNGLHSEPHEVDATADSSGWYAVCGVPGDGVFDIRAQLGARATPFVQVSATARGLAIRDLSVGGDSAAPAAPPAQGQSLGMSPAQGTAALDGVIRDPTGAPLGGAELTLPAVGAAATTGADGRFHMAALPSGTQPLVVAHLGLMPVRTTVDLANHHPVSIDIRMTQAVPVLATVKVQGKDVLSKLAGFEQRRAEGFGQFFTDQDIVKMQATKLTDVFRRAATLRVIRVDPKDSTFMLGIVSARGQVSLAKSNVGFCYPAVYIDGAFMHNAAHDINTFLDPSSVAGIEIYSDASTTPPQYKSGDCGTVVIWTH
jgi:hypothetical protein